MMTWSPVVRITTLSDVGFQLRIYHPRILSNGILSANALLFQTGLATNALMRVVVPLLHHQAVASGKSCFLFHSLISSDHYWLYVSASNSLFFNIDNIMQVCKLPRRDMSNGK